ncbi:MAG: HD domain-containing protein [Candidatus Aminicenantes bacterium]|nr:HD domain-containing protein [Candidatus Aminicenantes bacterium]
MRRGQTSHGDYSHAIRENTLLANDNRNRKNSFYQSLITRSLNLHTSKEADKSEFALGSNPYNFMILNKGKAPWKREGSKPPLAFVLSEEKEEQDYSSWGMESTEVRKMSSARNILRYMDLHYGNIFKDQTSNIEEDIAEKQIFFNTSLIYLIAATDGNEDSIGHSKLVASYTTLLTKDLGIEDKNFLVNIQRGALLHDVGKIGIPEFILRKARSLSEREKEILHEHPLLGYEMIEEFDFLKKAAHVVLYHHERYDGSGYPFSLVGEEIPLEARIFSLADTLDAITSDRPYRKGKSFEEALREMEKCRGCQFDPVLLDVFLSIPIEKWQDIKAETLAALSLPMVH